MSPKEPGPRTSVSNPPAPPSMTPEIEPAGSNVKTSLLSGAPTPAESAGAGGEAGSELEEPGGVGDVPVPPGPAMPVVALSPPGETDAAPLSLGAIACTGAAPVSDGGLSVTSCAAGSETGSGTLARPVTSVGPGTLGGVTGGAGGG